VRGLSAAIYGQVVVTSIVAALEIHEQSPPAQTLAAAGVTVAVFWIAHVYAEALATAANWRAAGRMLREESAMIAVALPTLAALALGALHVLSRAHSVVVSVSLGVVTLLVLGAVAAARAGGSRSRILATAVLGAGCGLIVVALKVVVH